MRPPGASEPQPTARWGVVLLLAAVLFLNYVDRGALPAAETLIQADLGLSERELGVLLSAFFWSYALLQIPVGWLAERYGARRVLAAGLSVWALATMLVGVAHTFATLLLLRILLGIGESVGFPCVSKLLASVVPRGSLARANGIVAFGYLFAPAVGINVGGLIMVNFGWRAAFLIFGALSLLWLVPWARVRLPRPAAAAGEPGSPSWAQILRQRALWGTSLGHFSANYTFYFVLSWLPYYLVHERGLSLSEMTSLASLFYAVNAVSALTAGWAIDRVSARFGRGTLAYKSSMVIAHVGFVGCMLGIAFGAPLWALAAMFGFQVLSGLSSPGTFGIAQLLAGPSAAARWVGIQNAIANLAGVIAPALTGLLVAQTHHFTSALIVGAVVSVLGIVGWGFMVRNVAPIAWDRGARCAPLPPATHTL